MKLRNKKTGEIVDFGYLQSDHVAPVVLTTYENDKPEMRSYNSLADLNEEWEDYEEPKQYYWYIDDLGIVSIDREDSSMIAMRKNFGNYFETEKEAKKAVEKIKAWKRLKDGGYYFTYDSIKEGHKKNFILRLNCKQEKLMKTSAECESNYRDLKLIFGDEQ